MNGGGTAVPPPQAIISLYGQWAGPGGLSYIIRQQGSYITIQEMNPWLGVAAVGEGTINGNIVNLSYTTAIGTAGQAQLQISPDGRQMLGQSRDMVTGVTMPMQMQR